jgi:hypothetical protein
LNRYEFEENERVLSMKCITLATAQTSSGHSQFIAVGTGYVWGEDVSAKGRVSSVFRCIIERLIKVVRFIFSISWK